jgi:hypothetical protein
MVNLQAIFAWGFFFAPGITLTILGIWTVSTRENLEANHGYSGGIGNPRDFD